MTACHGVRKGSVMVFQINEEEYLNPGDFIDRVVDSVVKEGAFIGRLNTWTPEDGESNVAYLKNALREDDKIAIFHPDWLSRETVIEKSVFYINPVHASTVDEKGRGQLDRLQRSVKKSVLDQTCEDFQRTFQDDAEWLDVFLDNLLVTLEDKHCDILYIQYISPPVALQTTCNSSMATMKTYLHLLNGGAHISGINVPTVYIGLPNSTFNCHTEDIFFCAINRHFSGAPKIWFIIPPRFYQAFLQFLSTLPISELFKNLKCYIQHKQLWLDPRLVIKAGIPVLTIVQQPGDIVYLLPNTIHWGVNCGLNYNEAMNFVCKTWVLSGMLASQRCNCNPLWNSHFDIRSTLVLLGADKEHIRAWNAGDTSEISAAFRNQMPLLHPDMCPAGCEEQPPDVAPKYKSTIKFKGGYKCPSGPCGEKKNYRGEDAKNALLRHVKSSHKSDEQKLCALVGAGFAKKPATVGTLFTCQYCGQKLSGAKRRRESHEDKCGHKQVKNMMK